MKRESISFTAVKIGSKRTRVTFRTKSGQEVIFRAKKDIPKIIRGDFIVVKKGR